MVALLPVRVIDLRACLNRLKTVQSFCFSIRDAPNKHLQISMLIRVCVSRRTTCDAKKSMKKPPKSWTMSNENKRFCFKSSRIESNRCNLRCDGERLSVFVKGPFCFTGPIVVEHVCVRDQRRCPVAIDLQAKVARANAHSGPFELLECANLGQRCNLTNGIKVLGNRLVAVFYLLQKVAPNQAIELLRRPENGHVAQSLWQYFIIGMEKRIGPVCFPVP